MNNTLFTILVVDDEPLNIQVINEYLLEHDTLHFEIMNANNGELALKIASKMLPDLVISDWNLGEMDGIELTKALKADERTHAIPIIIATGVMMNSQHLQTAMEAGAVDFIRKPIDRIELYARVRSVLEMSRYIQSVREQSLLIAEQEKAIMQKNIAHLQDRVNYKQREISSNISLLTQLERKHHEHLKQLRQLNPYLNTAGKQLLKKLTEDARMNQFSNSILELENKFEAINYDFFRLLVEKVPDITRNEKVLCAYLKMNMSQAEIAELLQKSTNSVHVSFSRLRQKFAVQTNIDLLQILNNLGE